VLKTLFIVVVCALAARMLWIAWSNSQDLSVYFRAVRLWFAGQNPYLISADDRGFIFKYPPWILPLFSPLSLMSWSLAKIVWAVLELVAIGFSVQWVAKRSELAYAASVCALLYWWIWLGHASMGQISVFILAVALWTGSLFDDPKAKLLVPAISLTAIALSSKLFSLISLMGLLAAKEVKRRVTAQWSFAVAVVLALTLILGHVWILAFVPGLSLTDLYASWIRAAGSGGAELGVEVVRGAANHGFPAAILRWAGISSIASSWDIALFFLLALVLGGLWHLGSRKLIFRERFTGWLALGVIVHPLAWHHSFVLVYPLSAFSLSAAMASRRKFLIFTALLGIAMIGIFIPQVLGVDQVKPFEFAACKAWGTVLGAWTLVYARRGR